MTAEGSTAGRRVLITGGGAGIGAVTARLLVQKGWRVALLDRDGEAAARTARDLGEGRARAYQGDVTDAAAVERAIGDMVATWGGIDDLVKALAVAGQILQAVAGPLDRTREPTRGCTDKNLLGI